MNELNFEDVSKDMEDLNALPDVDKLSSLATLARELWEAEKVIAAKEEELRKAKEAYNMISEFKLPELFNELGLSQFILDNGLKVTVKPYFSGKITDDLALKWLDDEGHGGLIKGQAIIAVPRSFDRQKLQKLELIAEELGLSYSLTESVHHSTLSAWLKEMITSGVNIPRDLFNVHSGFRSKIGK